MNHPVYHLRLNKAIDRLLMIELIRKLQRGNDLSEYTYYGFGGPYLEDFRLLYEFFPEIGMVSVEQDANTLKRQEFHRPCKTIRLEGIDFRSFLADYDSNNEKSIFWLDYTNLSLGAIEEFQILLEKVAHNSIVKVTLQASPGKYASPDGPDKFRQEFATFMASPLADPPASKEGFVAMLQDIVQVAAERTLPADTEAMFQPLASFWYADGINMFTLTGIVCKRAERKQIRNLFANWRFANLNWGKPMQINVPFLSTKERLHLQKHLPLKRTTGASLLRVLGYEIDGGNSLSMLKQYAEFYRYFPYFMKAVP